MFNLATEEPDGIESGAIGVTAALTSTVPSTNGANPAKNLHKTKQFIFLLVSIFLKIFILK